MLRSRCRNYCLIWTGSQQTKVLRNEQDGKLHIWRINGLEMERKQHLFQEEMAKDAVKNYGSWKPSVQLVPK